MNVIKYPKLCNEALANVGKTIACERCGCEYQFDENDIKAFVDDYNVDMQKNEFFMSDSCYVRCPLCEHYHYFTANKKLDSFDKFQCLHLNTDVSEDELIKIKKVLTDNYGSSLSNAMDND